MPWPWTRTNANANNDTTQSSPLLIPPTSSTLSADSNAPTTTSFLKPYTTPEALTTALLTTTLVLTLRRTHRNYLRRIPTAETLPQSYLRKRTLYGRVTRVGDGDNFHFFHMPGGRLAGWDWWPGRRRKDVGTGKELKGETIHVRIAGVDAPEAAHFGRPEQPFAKEALEWLRGCVGGRMVRVRVFSRDQYGRVVGGVRVRRWWGVFGPGRDVGLAMLRAGWATVYEAKTGSEFGGLEGVYREAEKRAKRRKIGMWCEPGLVGRMLGKKAEVVETPREYKTRMAKEDMGK